MPMTALQCFDTAHWAGCKSPDSRIPKGSIYRRLMDQPQPGAVKHRILTWQVKQTLKGVIQILMQQ